MDLVIALGTSGTHSKFRKDSASALLADKQICSRCVALTVRLTGGRKVLLGVLSRGYEIASADRLACGRGTALDPCASSRYRSQRSAIMEAADER